MLKSLNLFFSFVLVATVIALNGCSKTDQPTTSATDNNSAAVTEFDTTFPDQYAESVANPIVPTMDDRNFDRYIRFLARYLQLTPAQIEQVKGFYKDYHDALIAIRAKIKNKEYTDRKEVIADIKKAVNTFKESFLGILTAEQKAKLARLRHHGMGGGIVATTELFDEMSLNIEHSDVTLETYENEITNDANTSLVMDNHGPRGFLGFLIRALKLTDEQIPDIKGYIKAYNTSMNEIFKTLQQARAELRAALKIATTPEARKAAFVAYQEDVKAARTAIKTAHDTMMTSIYGKLTTDQQVIFKKIFRGFKG